MSTITCMHLPEETLEAISVMQPGWMYGETLELVARQFAGTLTEGTKWWLVVKTMNGGDLWMFRYTQPHPGTTPEYGLFDDNYQDTETGWYVGTPVFETIRPIFYTFEN